jgi:hypothetical protein
MARDLAVVRTPLTALTEAERHALAYFQNSGGPPISPDTADKLYELFLRGCTCAEIRRLNPGFSMGQIVHARVANGWDHRKNEHDDRLLGEANPGATRISLEACEFVALQLAAAHRLNRDRLLRYMQTGNEDDLGDLAITSLRQYKDVVELLQKLTGQDQKMKVKGEVLHRHEVVGAPAQEGSPQQTLTGEMAKEWLASLAQKKRGG